MDDNNVPLITSSDPFEYDPSLLDDELLQFINSVISPTPQKVDVLPAEPESHAQNTSILISNNNPVVAPPHDIEKPPPQLDNPKPPAATSSKGKGKKKLNATEVERERRHAMASLYADLRSVLPANKNAKRRQSISDLLHAATNHINSMKDGIQKLNDKKERLERKRSTPDSNTSISSITNSSQQQFHVTVKPCKEGFIEVTVGTNANDNDNTDDKQNVSLSKVLGVLNEEGLNVIDCFSSRINDKFIHTIQAQVDDGRTHDLGLLQQTLTNLHCL